MAKVGIMVERCESYGYCVKFCLRQVLEIGTDINSKGRKYVVPVRPESCIGYTIYGRICPDGVIKIYKQGEEGNISHAFMKGCKVIVEAVVQANCRFLAGYPTTPQNEISEYFSCQIPEAGSVLVQGESEMVLVNMVYDAVSAGVQVMTSSSSPGIALKSEGISYYAAARVPMAYVSASQDDPGVGSIQPAQMGYFQTIRVSGDGGFQMMVFTLFTVREAVDMTYAVFDYTDRDRNSVLIPANGVIGTMTEPVMLPEMKSEERVAALEVSKQGQACVGHELDYAHHAWIQSGHWLTSDMQKANKDAVTLYKSWKKNAQVEGYRLEDTEVVLTAYDISTHICKSAMELFRAQGVRAGLIRLITVHLFPCVAYNHIDYSRVKVVLNVEMSIPAQFVNDVAATVKDRYLIEACLCSGDNIMSRDKVLVVVKKIMEGE